jgi:hypothetical protein
MFQFHVCGQVVSDVLIHTIHNCKELAELFLKLLALAFYEQSSNAYICDHDHLHIVGLNESH